MQGEGGGGGGGGGGRAGWKSTSPHHIAEILDITMLHHPEQCSLLIAYLSHCMAYMHACVYMYMYCISHLYMYMYSTLNSIMSNCELLHCVVLHL